MKMIIVALALVAVAVAAPASDINDAESEVKTYAFEQIPEGYNYGYETDKGIKVEEQGQLKTVVDIEGKPHEVLVTRGSFSYFNNEGELVTVTYYADETGFHAEGDSIPKVPAVLAG